MEPNMITEKSVCVCVLDSCDENSIMLLKGKKKCKIMGPYMLLCFGNSTY